MTWFLNNNNESFRRPTKIVLTVTRNCHYRNEPVECEWQYMSCYGMDDCFHTHSPKNQVDNYIIAKREVRNLLSQVEWR